MVRIAFKVRQRTRITRVGELVDVEHLVTPRDEKADEIGADETGPACDEDFHA